MCGRYTIKGTDEIEDRFEVNLRTLARPVRPNWNAAPSQELPVVTETGNGRQIELMRWGLIPAWSKDVRIGYKLINARSETVFEKPIWKQLVGRQRCLIPADGFYEWQKADAGKQPYYIFPAGKTAAPGSLFAFAGIWSSWRDPAAAPGSPDVRTYSILTTRPNAEMESIHDRMPVILHRRDEADWLNPDMTESEDIERYLRPLEDGALAMFPVSKDVNTTRANDERLVQPLPGVS